MDSENANFKVQFSPGLTQRVEGPLLAFFIILKSISWSFSNTLGIKDTYEVIEVDLKCFGH